MESTYATHQQFLKPAIPLILETVETVDKTALVTFEVCTVATNDTPGAAKHKINVRKFDTGSPSEFILVRQNFDEIWRQNKVDDGDDQVGTVRAILRGDSLTQFNAVLSDPSLTAIYPATVEKGLLAVAMVVFPYRALLVQKLWMRRVM